jgi:hypothetical protein
MSRIKNAVSYDFGPADVIYVVKLREPLRVFTGRGRPVEDSGREPGSVAKRIFPGGFEITQLFVPGLRDYPAAVRSAIALRAMHVVRSEQTVDYVLNQRARNRAGLEALDRLRPV